MKLQQLEMFKAVAELGSLRLASEYLHKTQPAISQGIRQLETGLSLSLFSREDYRLALTDAGRVLYQHASRALDEVAMLQDVAENFAAGNETSVSLAIEASFDLESILPIFENVQNQFPSTQIVLRQEYLSGAIEAVLSGAARLAISSMDMLSEQNSSMEFSYMDTGRLLNVASPKLLARHPHLRLCNELINEYQIVVQDSGAGTTGRELGVQDGQRRWYVNDFTTKKMLIERGIGWGKVPYYHVESSLADGRLIALQLEDTINSIEVRYHAIKVKGQRLGPVAQALWNQLGTHFNSTVTEYPLTASADD